MEQVQDLLEQLPGWFESLTPEQVAWMVVGAQCLFTVVVIAILMIKVFRVDFANAKAKKAAKQEIEIGRDIVRAIMPKSWIKNQTLDLGTYLTDVYQPYLSSLGYSVAISRIKRGADLGVYGGSDEQGRMSHTCDDAYLVSFEYKVPTSGPYLGVVPTGLLKSGRFLVAKQGDHVCISYPTDGKVSFRPLHIWNTKPDSIEYLASVMRSAVQTPRTREVFAHRADVVEALLALAPGDIYL